MIFFFPSIRCARHLPHSIEQGLIPAVIPDENLVRTELFRIEDHIFTPAEQAAREPAAPAKWRPA